MTLVTTKIELAKQLLNTSDKTILNQIKIIFETQSKDWWNELPDDVKASVNKGLKQSENEETFPHKEVMKKYQKWRKK